MRALGVVMLIALYHFGTTLQRGSVGFWGFVGLMMLWYVGATAVNYDPPCKCKDRKP